MKKLRNRIWLVFAVFSVTILGITWGFQTLAFNRLYYRQELARIETLGNEITEEWKNVRFSQPASIRFYRDELPVRIFNQAGAETPEPAGISSDPDPLGAAQFISKYEASGNAVYINTVGTEGPDTGFIIFGRKIPNLKAPDNSLYVYIVDPLGPLNSVRTIMTQQLVLLGCVTVILAIIIAYFMASTIAKPIVDLTEQAALLAQGDYSVKFGSNDVTEIRQLSDTLNDATQKLAQIDETKNTLLASVSHDLRTPLTMIKAYAEMIRDLSGNNEERRREHIGIILQEADWMSDLITDILEYSRIRSGTMNYEMRVLDLASLTDVCTERFSESMVQHDKGVTIDWENTGYYPVWGDLVRIQRVINNLLDNAIKFSDPGGTVHIRIRNDAALGTVWEITDHGPGIAPENMDAIWDRYFTRDIGAPRKSGSTGLGLPIVRGILEAHGAKYGVFSTPGEGARFWFSMKAVQEEGEPI